MRKFLDVGPEQAREDMLVLIREVAYAEGDFTLASGKKSDYYIDGRRVTIHPRGAVLTGVLFLQQMEDLITSGGTWGITGLSMGADPIITGTAVVASLKGLTLYPFYCRKEAKGHGRRGGHGDDGGVGAGGRGGGARGRHRGGGVRRAGGPQGRRPGGGGEGKDDIPGHLHGGRFTGGVR